MTAVYKISILRREDYSGEHRSWIEEVELPAELVEKIIADAAPTKKRGWFCRSREQLKTIITRN